MNETYGKIYLIKRGTKRVIDGRYFFLLLLFSMFFVIALAVALKSAMLLVKSFLANTCYLSNVSKFGAFITVPVVLI